MISPEELDQVATDAHEAWVRNLLEKGVPSRYAAWGDEELMVPWRQLSERAHEYNREGVRNVYAAMMEAGYSLVPTAGLVRLQRAVADLTPKTEKEECK